LLYLFRKIYLEPIKFGHAVPVHLDANYWWGLLVVPCFWVLLFVIIGGYADIFRRFRSKELEQTLLIALIGSIVIFFALLLDDTIAGPRYYYRSFSALFLLNFGILFFLRFLLTTRTVGRVHSRRIGFNTLLVGGNERAIAIHQEIEGLPNSPGNRFDTTDCTATLVLVPSDSTLVGQGSHNGLITLDSEPPLYNGVSSGDPFYVTGPTAFLEMDYRSDTRIEVGVRYTKAGTLYQVTYAYAAPTGISGGVLPWNKIYIDLATPWGAASGAVDKRFYIRAKLENGATTGEVQVDNIKLVRS
jgi:hypothetical protein